MSRTQKTKGYMYTLEVLIAMSMIIVATVLMFRTPPAKPETETSIIKKQGFDSLEYLENSDELRSLAFSSNKTQIENLLRNLTTSGYEVHVCGEGDSCTTYDNVPSNQTVIVIDYYQSGYRDAYLPKKVRLLLWRIY